MLRPGSLDAGVVPLPSRRCSKTHPISGESRIEPPDRRARAPTEPTEYSALTASTGRNGDRFHPDRRHRGRAWFRGPTSGSGRSSSRRYARHTSSYISSNNGLYSPYPSGRRVRTRRRVTTTTRRQLARCVRANLWIRTRSTTTRHRRRRTSALELTCGESDTRQAPSHRGAEPGCPVTVTRRGPRVPRLRRRPPTSARSVRPQWLPHPDSFEAYA